MYDAFLNGYQAVLMAPTEILAFQHYNSLIKLLGDKIKIGLLTNSKQEILNIKILDIKKSKFLPQRHNNPKFH